MFQSGINGILRLKVQLHLFIQLIWIVVVNFYILSLYSTEIISILQDSPANCLPLFKFTEIYEKK